MAGCCYGRPTTMPWGITFHNPLAGLNVGTPLDVPLHPTQLYDAGGELIILIALLATEKKGRPFAGRTLWLYMLLYGITRYIVEIYRGDDRGIFFSTFSTSQLVSLAMVPISLFMLWRLSKRAA
jgi:phosphatidylglycerol:prolipoprotein diacylglycerol transferase